MRKPWNLPSYPVYSLLTWGVSIEGDTIPQRFPQKQAVRGRKNILKGAYRSISDQEISVSEDEMRNFSGNMNIMTYVIPVSMHLKHYILAIYRDTQSLTNWQVTHRGILQILASEHSSLVRVLGKKSGKTYDKMRYLSKKGLISDDGLLSGIAGYLDLEEIEQLPDGGGDHELYLCRVISSKSYHERVLMTDILIQDKIIL